MIDIHVHLNAKQKQLLLKLLEKFKELFSGKLGKIFGPPAEIKLQSLTYTIPQALLRLAKNEISDFIEKYVLVKVIESSWKSPSLFRKKKDDGIRFVSDLRKLNEAIERDAFLLPVIDDVT